MVISFEHFLLSLLVAIKLNGAEALERNEVTYYLFTEQSPETYIEVDASNIASHIDSNAETIFLVHGWTESRETLWFEDLKNAYLDKKNQKYNVIEVDWSGPAKEKYRTSVDNARIVGQFLAEFIAALAESAGISPGNFHVIGHSLGGQVAGFAGKALIRMEKRKLGRITALDPAGPLFSGISVRDSNRLNGLDAEVVVVIHTDGGLFSFGYQAPCGTVDIYPNGGTRMQPGCPWRPFGVDAFCSHHRSYEYFIDAVQNPGTLMATKCLSYPAYQIGMCTEAKSIDIGAEITQRDSGLYYLKTNSGKPFGKINQ